jgi:hypothetical protein
MLSRRYRRAALAWLSLSLGAGCFGGPISDFPGKAEGDGMGTGTDDHHGADAGASPGAHGDGDDAAGDGDTGELPSDLDGGSCDVDGGARDGGVASDASVDAGDATRCGPGAVDAGDAADAGA